MSGTSTIQPSSTPTIHHASSGHSRFADLSARAQLSIAWEIFRLQARIVFSHKFVWFMAGILIYFVVAYIINYNQSVIERMPMEDVLPVLLEFPLAALAVYLSMQVIASEKDNRTLEVMFTTAGSRYKVWLLRLGTLNVILLILAFALSALAFFTFTDIPIIGMALHAFVPTFFAGSMTLYFAVRFRSGFAAGMVAAGLLVLMLMFVEPLSETRYFLFFNPYEVPRRLDPGTWNLSMWQNRIGVLVLAGLMLFAALRGMEVRERLLR
jgi:ABC-type transport system involved in multi-copper enzyme maturation permease subunit